ncbi:MAG: hypothetical protein ACKVS9_07495 [Phycisphaerae bacterium]
MLTNSADATRADAGLLRRANVRRERVSADVRADTLRLRIPAALAEKLGLRGAQPTLMVRGDGATRMGAIVRTVEAELLSRSTGVSAVIDSEISHVIVGQMVLDMLDLVIGERAGMLVPRYPNGICVEV